MITTSEKKSITAGINRITKKYWFRNGQRDNADYLETLKYIMKKVNERIKYQEDRLRYIESLRNSDGSL